MLSGILMNVMMLNAVILSVMASAIVPVNPTLMQPTQLPTMLKVLYYN